MILFAVLLSLGRFDLEGSIDRRRSIHRTVVLRSTCNSLLKLQSFFSQLYITEHPVCICRRVYARVDYQWRARHFFRDEVDPTCLTR